MTEEGQTDFLFGWRWLLPMLKGNTIFLGGSFGAYRDWWIRKRDDAKFTTEAAGSDAWLIDADQFAVPRDAPLPDLAEVCFAAVIGTGSRIESWRRVLAPSFPSIREYGLLPPRSPRVVVPLGRGRKTPTALALHRPGRRRLRLLLLASAILCRMGIDAPLRRRVLLVAAKHGNTTPSGVLESGLESMTGSNHGDYALYLGTPDCNRKTVALPLNDPNSDVIYKIASTRVARASLEKEAEALSWLSSTRLSNRVPALRRRIDTRETLTLALEYKEQVTPLPGWIKNASVNFLVDLLSLGTEEKPLSHWMDDDRLDRIDSDARAWFRKRADEGAKLVVCRTHGDFAFWNCAWSRDGFVVFDWEASAPDGVALGDAFHRVVALPLAAVRRSDPCRLARECLDLGRRVIADAGLLKIDVPLQLAVWALERLDVHSIYGRLAVEAAWMAR